MSETLLSRFNHHWEAEMARGYLEDAGIASRLVSDNLGAGQAYMGSVVGASLLVATERAEEAYRVLADAGLVEGLPQDDALDDDHGVGSGDGDYDLRVAATPPTLRADRDDLTEQLGAARKAEMRHAIRCLIGMTPAALIPFVGLALEGNVALMALLCVLVVLVEGWRWIAAGRRATRLEVALKELEEAQEEAGWDPS